MCVSKTDFTRFFRVRGRGLEPPCPNGRYHLKVVRLPVSPPALKLNVNYSKVFTISNITSTFNLFYLTNNAQQKTEFCSVFVLCFWSFCNLWSGSGFGWDCNQFFLSSIHNFAHLSADLFCRFASNEI